MFLQRVKEIFDLNIPMGRLRYFITTIIAYVIICIILILSAPNIIVYEGEGCLFKIFTSGVFEKSEILFYFLIGDILLYTFLFTLNTKRLLDITANKKISITISAIFILFDFILEYFIENTTVINLIYLGAVIIIFLFLCLKKGVNGKGSEEKEV